MVQGAQHGLAHLLKESAKARIARKVRAHDQWVDEVSDQTRQFRVISTRRGRADENFVLPGIAMQEHLKRSQQDHVECDVVITADCLQSFYDSRCEFESMRIAAIGLDRWRLLVER